MPLTPIAVSAWRTSSSLKGLIMATTSFMVRPSFPGVRKVDHARICASHKSGVSVWHLSERMAQKDCSSNRKTIAAGGFRSLASASEGQVRTISVFGQNPFSSPAAPGPPVTALFKE
jgi:hypothetical protein